MSNTAQNRVDVAAAYVRNDIEQAGPVGYPWPHERHLAACEAARVVTTDPVKWKQWTKAKT